jgi:hypothetical protein
LKCILFFLSFFSHFFSNKNKKNAKKQLQTINQPSERNDANRYNLSPRGKLYMKTDSHGKRTPQTNNMKKHLNVDKMLYTM